MESNLINIFKNFKDSLQRKTVISEVPLSSEVEHNIPTYDGIKINEKSNDKSFRYSLLNEWAKVFKDGAGIILIKRGLDISKDGSEFVIAKAFSNISYGIEIFKYDGSNWVSSKEMSPAAPAVSLEFSDAGYISAIYFRTPVIAATFQSVSFTQSIAKDYESQHFKI